MHVIITTRQASLIATQNPAQIVIDMPGMRILKNNTAAQFSPAVFRFAAGVIAASGRLVTRNDLIEALWGDDPDGGPIDPNKLLDVYLHKSRQRLMPLGIGIATHWGYGVKAEPFVVPTKMMLAMQQAKARKKEAA